MINIDNKINDLKNYFKSNDNIVAAWFTGSYGTEYQREDSDIDIALLFEKPIGIMEEMDIACRISEILDFDNIDTINLLSAPITLKFKVIDEGRSIYEKDYYKVCDFMEEVFNKYRDEKYYLDRFMKDFYESYGVRRKG
ncbi:type VII toxin-antitoxin system MntA family adenylyltransferase antitoxin [Clostridium botulinum]|uniref:type VII toxin-antitoxin system MntA family adenylyltransferase antitoxin n=1 Tax=Clostridium botulinum TaxID=1491 RepID=UPI00077367D1|nr:nucleotidyltransferase domain-containing protein [Clostridium botulinum]MBY6809285.1 nucleotidyltransferase domain-containing protein [Clostridium botulinum]MBY6822727.1 nucleotidyltransferase domain-containing protein [Clostridium botulinum]MBY6833339.1 nucleotidyltransferase domain-containing protein [Clostridium botulinum]MBY6931610.1 nucleotidyltransferase domain-containing protein [Clostridium botulinum]MBY6971400.1 nucleotidyltransferase domain-containing protein [Clostridium botulinu